jgi:hypothetical protein
MPDRFSGEILAQIMSSAMYLWLRLNLELDRRIRESDEENRFRYGACLSEGFVNALMPQLFKLGEYIGQMSQIQAATARQWALTGEILHQNEEPASQPARRKRLRIKMPTESQPVVDVQTDEPTNGTAGAQPTTTALSISDRRVAEDANEEKVSVLLKIKNEMYGT